MQSVCLASMYFLIGIAEALVGAGTHNVGLRGGRSDGLLHLAAEAQPELVAHTLASVEDAWETQVIKFVECNATEGNSAECSYFEHGFSKSCVTVAKAILSASNGEKDTVTEYMNEICNEKELHGWKMDRCQMFAKTILSDMSADAYDNRENLKPAGICHSFWSAVTVEGGAEAASLAQQKQKDEVLRMEAEKAKAEAVRAEKAKQQRIAAAESAAKERRRQGATRLAAEQAAAAQKAKEASEKRATERRKRETKRQKREAAAQAAVKASRQSAMATLKEAEHQEELVNENLKEATIETKEVPRPKLVPAAATNGSTAQASPAAKATADTKGVPMPKLASAAAAKGPIAHANPAAKAPTKEVEHAAPNKRSPIKAPMKALSKAGNTTSQHKV